MGDIGFRVRLINLNVRTRYLPKIQLLHQNIFHPGGQIYEFEFWTLAFNRRSRTSKTARCRHFSNHEHTFDNATLLYCKL